MTYMFLGQSGILLDLGDNRLVLIDPYLSDSVEEKYGGALRRRFPPPSIEAYIRHVTHVFVTHAHEDHADPASLQMIVEYSPNVEIYGPADAEPLLCKLPDVHNRFRRMDSCSDIVCGTVHIGGVPAAHTQLEIDSNGMPTCMGYLIEFSGKRIYHSGDTMPHPEIVSAVNKIGPPDVAFLPCNERNYYRERAGIIGNMSVREMLGFAAEIGAAKIIPIHWDLFEPNTTEPEEIRLVHLASACQIPIEIPEHGLWKLL